MRRAKHLVKVGYDPAYGARPLKRAIQKEVETPLARKLVAGEIRDGQKVRVDGARIRNWCSRSNRQRRPKHLK